MPSTLQRPQRFNALTSLKPQHLQSLDISVASMRQRFNASTPQHHQILNTLNDSILKASCLNAQCSMLNASMPQCLNVSTSSTPQHFNFALSTIKAKWSTLFVVVNDKVRRTAEPIATRLFHAFFNVSASFWCPIFNHGYCSVDFGNTSR